MPKQISVGVNTPQLPLEWEAVPFVLERVYGDTEIFGFYIALRRASLRRETQVSSNRDWPTTSMLGNQFS